MEPLNPSDLSRALMNASRREASQMKIPYDLTGLDWHNLGFLGWTDPHAPQRAYLFAPVDGEPLGAILRVTPAVKKQTMCSWCEDITEVSDVRMSFEGQHDPSRFIAERVQRLQRNIEQFLRRVRDTD
ncbi:FBP domain-containing protein [Nesterenkonia flava]|uniref:FBP domain-containing protein n=1 Tax=Nesterenkonia flava TaxID=469799 RepID=A0ABU1FPX4_9MICC|nr:FBP domain-containing protein [Nesterenkonia flava]MDR5710695.1 FBP domain-containing protein [Nesterenkonia flava]